MCGHKTGIVTFFAALAVLVAASLQVATDKYSAESDVGVGSWTCGDKRLPVAREHDPDRHSADDRHAHHGLEAFQRASWQAAAKVLERLRAEEAAKAAQAVALAKAEAGSWSKSSLRRS